MKLMWLLWLFVVLPVVLAQADFGKSYLKNSRLCHQWTCINTKLGLPDSLPYQQQTQEVLRGLLPAGDWQEVVDKVLENCYGNRTRRFTNTCPGQALMHCIVDQMVENCPESSWKKEDACSPVSSLAGLKFMFAQSRYLNLEKNLPKERRPPWFLKNYFDTKCCDLPVMFDTTLLEECGFASFMNYYTHGPRYTDVQTVNFEKQPSPRPPAVTNEDSLHIVNLNEMTPENGITDPLDCCDMTQFIQPSWRSECDFHLSWGGQDRLVISSHSSTEAPSTTTTERVDQVMDLMLVPHSCEKETCIFRKLGILEESGRFDVEAYTRMLHNFTNSHQAWAKAKNRVVSNCLNNPTRTSTNYNAGCEINNVLSCTFDVLTENCPYTRKSDDCKSGKRDVGCQISSNKYRPKNRREICLLPELIHHDHLTECGLVSLYQAEHVAVPPKPRKHGWFASKYTCKDSALPTTCMMKRMGILNRYNFMDYFKMKDRIRQFTSEQAQWAALMDIYMSAIINIPMYADHCNSEKKLLNVIDTMLMTCPISNRKNTPQCNKIFADMVNTAPVDKQNVTAEKLDEIMKHYHHVFMPNQPKTSRIVPVIRKKQKHSKIVKKPIYEYGFLNSKDAPTVKVINVRPEVGATRPMVVSPVYLRPIFPYRDNSNKPFALHEYIAQAHTSTPTPVAHTIPTVHNNVYSTRLLFTPTVPTLPQSEVLTDPFETWKPE